MKKILLSSVLILGSCTISRELFGRYYWVGGGLNGISRMQLEQRVSNLYRDGTFTSNSQLWLSALARDGKQRSGNMPTLSIESKNGYVIDKQGKKTFLLYKAKTQTFYLFGFWNFRGLRSHHTPCDLVVEDIKVLQPDATLQRVEWQSAKLALADFKQNLLPTIRERAKQP